jgi:hypothetical protein
MLLEKADSKKEGPQVKARSAPGGFKPDAAAGLIRNATTSACVGWDAANIENHVTFRKQGKHLCLLTDRLGKRLDDHQDDNSDHQNRRHFIDNTIEFLCVPVAVGSEGLHQARKKAVDPRQQHHQ